MSSATILSMFFNVASLALEQSYECSGAREFTLNVWSKWNIIHEQQRKEN